jgi:hypothetical protein
MIVIDPKKRITKKFENCNMFILGEVRKIPEVTLSLIPQDGRWCMSFDEYNRIANDIHEQLRHRRKVKYKG